MAYGKKYTFRWLTVTNDTLYFDILAKDYTGTVTELTATDQPCVLSYEEDDPYPPFKASKATVQFRNELSTPLSSFYNEDDEYWKGELRDALDDTIKWAGFLVQDDCAESFTDPPYPVTLVFTDNIGLLKEIPYNEAVANYAPIDYLVVTGQLTGIVLFFTGIHSDLGLQIGDTVIIGGVEYEITYIDSVPYLQLHLLNTPGPNGFYETSLPQRSTGASIGKFTLWSFIRLAIQNTGVALPVRVFNNLFETSMDEAGNMLDQTRVHNGKWIDDKGEWAKIYTIAEDILTTFKATLVQADGFWNVIRWGEAFKFTGNAIEGLQYDGNFLNSIAVTLAANFDPFDPATKDNCLVDANAVSRILRPYKLVRETFNYKQPKQLIIGSDLQTLGAFIDTREETIDSIVYRFDRYELPSVWKHWNGDESYIEVKTQVATLGLPNETEVERYIITPKIGNELRAVRFNPIEVTKGDVFNFSLEFRHVTGTSDNDIFNTRFILVTANGFYYPLTRFPGSGSSVNVHWTGPFAVAVVDTATTVPQTILGSADDSQYTAFDLSAFVEEGGQLPALPADGILLIDIAGSNDTNGSLPNINMQWKNIVLTIYNRINDSTDIIGHVHSDTAGAAKNSYDEEVNIDDSPRNTIAGTLFTNELTTFGADIGDIYFTRTNLWGFKGEAKDKRLGQFITNERHTLQRQSRMLLDCDFVFHCPLLTPVSVMFITSISSINFIFGVCSFDMMNMKCNTTLWELHFEGETPFITEYEFKYLYQQN